MQSTTRINPGIQTFLIIWVGQVVSLMGTGMTRFALLIWAYEQTGNATTLALLGFFSFGSTVLFSPIAGIWVDRFDRRLVMMFTDLGAGLMTILMLILFLTGDLAIWHLYVAQFVTGIFDAFQRPAYAAATTTLVPKGQFARANGLRSLGRYAMDVLAPIFGGLALRLVGIEGVFLIDIVTFLIAMGTLSIVRIPSPATGENAVENYRFRDNLQLGIRFIFQRKGLLGLLLIYMGINLFAALTYFAILPTMILARTGNDELALASVQAVLGIGGVIGGLIISIKGLQGKLIHYVLGGAAISFLLGDMLFAVGRSVEIWLVAALIASFFIPFIISAERSIWQLKVPADIQGRVFSIKEMLQLATAPIGYLIAGPIADLIMEPAMMPGGSLTSVLGDLVGTGTGAGMGAMFLGTAVFGCLISLSGYLIPAIRNIESELPDAN